MELINEWYDIIKPRKSSEIIGNSGVIDKINFYLKNNKKGQVLLLQGPTGVGKTTSAKLILKELGYQNE